MVTRKSKEYDSSSIESLSYPENVRAKPGMYMGVMGSPAVFQCLREVLDNCIDECLAGHASLIEVVVDGDKMSVVDNGRGIPSGMTSVGNVSDGSKTKIPTIRAVFGVLHTSGKFNDSAYQVSRGSHGIGVKGTNALSSHLNVRSLHAGKWQAIDFQEGRVVKDARFLTDAPKHPATGAVMKKGTLVTFTPDYEIVGKGARLSIADLSVWCQLSSYFTPQATLTIHVKKDGKFLSKTYHSPEGPVQYLNDRVDTLRKSSEFGLLDELTFQSTSPLHECVIRFSSYDGCDVRAFTNGLENKEGGHHLNSLLSALKDTLQPLANKKQQFTLNELKDGLIGLINVKLSGPSFASQTKEKLTDERAQKPLYEILFKDLTEFFKQNKKLALAIVDRAARLKEMKTKFVASKQMITALKKISQKGLPAKAATAPKCLPADRECYLLEGDCFLAGTLIHTVSGDVPIEQLTQPFVGASLNPETGGFPHVLMSASFTRKTVTEVIDVEFEDGKIVTCTPEHEWLTVNRGYVQAQHLTPEDVLLCVHSRD